MILKVDLDGTARAGYVTNARVPVRLVPVRLEPARLAPARLAPARLAPARLAPVRLAPVRLGAARSCWALFTQEGADGWGDGGVGFFVDVGDQAGGSADQGEAPVQSPGHAEFQQQGCDGAGGVDRERPADRLF